ncbi:MAG TPA: serine protease [Firmicutes bacterium]|nr:serine protease [Bacillota bacterium]
MDYNQYNNYNVNNTGDDSLSNKNDIGKKLVKIVIITSLFSVLIGIVGCVCVFKAFPNLLIDSTTNITKTEKEVTVTDKGIADAVDKVHDSVVVIKTYVNNQLYATGTGFIYKKVNGKYYFITNNHVIEGGDQIKVQFADESEVIAKLENGDKYADICVLSIELSKNYPVIEVGNNVDTRVGDTVFAIGSPLDYSVFSYSVTRGIISGKEREVAVSVSGAMNDWIMQVLQTDAAINNGNSGGPLCNINGQVIGVTNMKLASDKIEGMGFAIPIEEAASYADAIINGEDITRPYIGASLANANTAAAVTRYGIDMQDGVVVESVEPSLSADVAGLKRGDIIKKMDDVEVKDIATLRYQLYKYKVGDTIVIEYIRNGNTKTTELKLGAKK